MIFIFSLWPFQYYPIKKASLPIRSFNGLTLLETEWKRKWCRGQYTKENDHRQTERDTKHTSQERRSGKTRYNTNTSASTHRQRRTQRPNTIVTDSGHRKRERVREGVSDGVGLTWIGGSSQHKAASVTKSIPICEKGRLYFFFSLCLRSPTPTHIESTQTHKTNRDIYHIK